MSPFETDNSGVTERSDELVASQIMHRGCTCIEDDASLVEAAELMDRLDVGALPVCGPDDRLQGVITDRDIVIKALAAGRDLERTCTGDLVDGSLIWAFEDAPVSAIASLMQEHLVRRVPIMNRKKRLVGMISEADLALFSPPNLVGEVMAEIASAPPMQHPI